MPCVRLPLAICLCLAFAQAQAGVIISGTRQIYAEPRREITVRVSNDDQQAARRDLTVRRLRRPRHTGCRPIREPRSGRNVVRPRDRRLSTGNRGIGVRHDYPT